MSKLDEFLQSVVEQGAQIRIKDKSADGGAAGARSAEDLESVAGGLNRNLDSGPVAWSLPFPPPPGPINPWPKSIGQPPPNTPTPPAPEPKPIEN